MFQGHGVICMPIDALSVLCAQLTRDLLAIAKFLSCLVHRNTSLLLLVTRATAISCRPSHSIVLTAELYDEGSVLRSVASPGRPPCCFVVKASALAQRSPAGRSVVVVGRCLQ